MSIRRLYESTFIINAALEDPDVEAVIRRVTDYIENHGGQFVEMSKCDVVAWLIQLRKSTMAIMCIWPLNQHLKFYHW